MASVKGTFHQFYTSLLQVNLWKQSYNVIGGPEGAAADDQDWLEL